MYQIVLHIILFLFNVLSSNPNFSTLTILVEKYDVIGYLELSCKRETDKAII